VPKIAAVVIASSQVDQNKTGERDALRRRQAFFAYFLLPLGQKVRRLAGRDPPVSGLPCKILPEI